MASRADPGTLIYKLTQYKADQSRRSSDVSVDTVIF